VIQTISKVINNKQISNKFYQIDFEWKKENSIPLPGQFLTVRVANTTAPLLRRPFAFSGYNSSENTASFIYLKRGLGTEILTSKSTGDTLDLIGPLGNSTVQDESVNDYVIVAGGIGLGPMLFTAKYLQKLGREVLFILGYQDKADIPNSDSIKHVTPVLCTDNGSEGFKGTTVDYLRVMDKMIIENVIIIACGPLPMLKGCHEIAQNHNLECRVSMEQIIACGVGACMGCVIKIVKEPGFARVCEEGPTFNSRDIKWT
jgi:dihydroorotate dehydrogenase electron transfer subunit